MRQALSLVLVFLMMTHLSPMVFGEDNVSSQIAAMPAGTNIEVRLKNKERMRGTRGEVSSLGFTLADPSAGDHQLAFDDVRSVKQLTKKSHSTRNAWIGLGIGVGVVVVMVGVIVAVLAKTGNLPY